LRGHRQLLMGLRGPMWIHRHRPQPRTPALVHRRHRPLPGSLVLVRLRHLLAPQRRRNVIGCRHRHLQDIRRPQERKKKENPAPEKSGYEMTPEELDAWVQEDVRKQLKPKKPPPKEPV